ncbi:hypothetical protein HF576_16395 [Microbacterium sp. CFH 90308]|uniref:Uncharacterized protein n=1 Tax=Microbacterium salsuginis TaxID=2722803 RepID=A0ABX1KGL9_9MICO|nr:hypothetical protein [Microbacterium sp. CFH 90308]NLP85428.1 hypothetical protein [Microbacterium sp. CFH 90308]
MSTTTQDSATPTSDTSPWWEDPRVARLLHRAAADGAVILTEVEYLAGFPDDEQSGDDWWLCVNFGSAGWVRVQYTTESGFWLLEVDTMTGELAGRAARIDDHLAASFAVVRAAALCRDLNRLVKRDQNFYGTISDEVVAIMGDCGMEPNELAARLCITHGVLMSKLSGSTTWTPVDIVRLHRTFGAETMERLYEVMVP